MTDIVDKKYLNIQDVSQRTGVPSYTLRYWEKEFKQIKPERYSGIRKYSNADVEIINQEDLLGRPKVCILNEKLQKLFQEKAINIDVSISHVCENAISNVVVKVNKE